VGVQFPELRSRLPMIGDNPTPDKDFLHFSRYADPLLDLITDRLTDTPLTIGVFGKWGSGKTTLLNMVEDTIRDRYQYPTIWFNPWLYQSESNLIIPLLHTIHDYLRESKVERLKEVAKLVAIVVAQLAASEVLKHLTLEKVSFEEIEKRVNAYVDKRGAALSAIRTLRSQLQGVVDEMTGKGQKYRLIIFIDDLDRCVPTKIIQLLEAMKLFLDLKHTVVFLAIDREVVQQGVQVFFKEFNLQGQELVNTTEDYLDKMIQLPFYLHALGSAQIDQYLRDLSQAEDLAEHASLFRGALFPNPRKIKRVLNIFRLNAAVAPQLFAGADGQSKRIALAKLVLIQQQWNDLYKSIVRNPDLPSLLERVYRGTLHVTQQAEWAFLQDRQEPLRKICAEYYRPGSELDFLFKYGDGFESLDLSEYLYLLG
jgi:KAP family P-loop domain